MTDKDDGFGLSEIGQIAVTVQDLERATQFYRDVLGMRLLFEAPGLAFFQCGQVRLMLSPPERPEFDHPASIIYFKVGDIEASHQTLADRGVRFEEEPTLVHKAPDHDLWIASFRDCERNLLALMSEVPRHEESDP